MRDKPKTAIIMIEERCSLKFRLGKVLLQAAVPTTSKCRDRFPPSPVKTMQFCFHFIGFRQGQGPVAKKMISNATKAGDRVFLEVQTSE